MMQLGRQCIQQSQVAEHVKAFVGRDFMLESASTHEK